MKQEKQIKNPKSTQNNQQHQGPFFKPGMFAGLVDNRCAGWVNDMESLTKKVARQYGNDFFQGPVVVRNLRITTGGKWYAWESDTPDGVKEIVVSIAGLPGYIPVRIQGNNYPTLRYTFTCDDKGEIHFTQMP